MASTRDVWLIVRDGRPRTALEVVRELAERGIVATTATATARIRDLRKEQFGSHPVVCARIEGAHRYFLIRRDRAMDAARNRNENGPTAGA